MKYQNKKIIFICEASPQIGLGHLIRCSALSKYFIKKKWVSTLITSRVSEDYREIIKNSFTNIILNKNDEISLLKNMISEYEVVLIDNYKFSFNKQVFIKDNFKTIIFDDFPHRKIASHYLIDPTLGRKKSDYKNFVSSDCNVLTGQKFVQLRENFQKKNIIRKEFLNYKNLPILIFLGGGDNLVLICKILKILNKSKLINDLIVICRKSEKEKIMKLSLRKKINFYHSLNDKELFNLFCKVGLVVGGAGSSCWERCITGLPSVIIPISENQQKIANELNLQYAAISIQKKDVDIKLFPAICSLLLNEYNYLKMSKSASSICDGYGIKRLYEIITRR